MVFLLILAVILTAAAIAKHRAIATRVAVVAALILAVLHLSALIGWLPEAAADLWAFAAAVTYTLGAAVLAVLEPSDL